MDKQIVKVACRRHDWTAALFDNKVQLSSLHLEISEQANVGVGELLRNRDLDFAECGLAGFLRARSGGARVRALPVFIRCAFRHSYIFVHADSGIRDPKDLEGKRVGTTYGMTANVWARGLLMHEYGVRLGEVRWFNAETEDNSYVLPPGIQFEYVPKDTDLQEWLIAGKIDALIHPDLIPSELLARKNVKRLFPDAAEEEKKSYRHSRSDSCYEHHRLPRGISGTVGCRSRNVPGVLSGQGARTGKDARQSRLGSSLVLGRAGEANGIGGP